MTEFIYRVSDEDENFEAQYFRSVQAAVNYANEKIPGLSWYQITAQWWRGVRAYTGHAWSVTRHELN